jgi:hypothetical protein
VEISELIHDNVIPGVTEIQSAGKWAGTKCYMHESSEQLSNRKDVCDGNQLKKATPERKKTQHRNKANAPAEVPADKAPPKAPPGVPVAQETGADEGAATLGVAESGSDGGREIVADGPGPNNEPLVHESLGELPDAELASAEPSEGIG